MIRWDKWIGAADGRQVMWVRNLLKLLGCRVDLHMFVDVDSLESFHTHCGYAVRIILSGGYVEELEDGRCYARRAGDIGLVRPSTSHRVDRLLYGAPAYTLWLRGPEIAKIELRGAGWPRGGTPWRCARCSAYGIAKEVLQGGACPDCGLAQ